MPEDEKEDIKDKIEEIAEHAADGSVSLPIDINKDGKPDMIFNVSGKLVAEVGGIVLLCIGLTKLFGIW